MPLKVIDLGLGQATPISSTACPESFRRLSVERLSLVTWSYCLCLGAACQPVSFQGVAYSLGQGSILFEGGGPFVPTLRTHPRR